MLDRSTCYTLGTMRESKRHVRLSTVESSEEGPGCETEDDCFVGRMKDDE